ncbi:MAG: cupin domain-containing protein [Actinomycetota bacterium]|nr:cupin domain-containing protein [Actinomycetota bacterium]
MIEKKYSYKLTDAKTIERIISDENLDINHMVLPKGESLPEHFSNSNVYLIIANGRLTIKLNEQKEATYERGDIINVPFKIRMLIYNEHEELLEFFVVKSPSPKKMK